MTDLAVEPFSNRVDFDSAVDRLVAAAEAYYAGDGTILMADAEYDALEARIRATEAERPEWRSERLDRVAAGIEIGDIAHSAPMLSLAKATEVAEIAAWFERLTELTGNPEPLIIVEPKLDGVAIAARYEDGRLARVLTRGGGEAGEDVTAQFDAGNVTGLPLELPERVTFEVRGECFMTTAQFEEANRLRVDVEQKEAFVNARNATAGTVRAMHRDYPTEMTFAAYSALGPDAPAERHQDQMRRLLALGIETAGSCVDVEGERRDLRGVEEAIETIGSLRPTLDFDIDGAVAKADSIEDREAAGATGAHPRWAIAFKYPAEERTTKLIGIDITPGRTGALVPRAELEPVFVAGATVTFATLHNPEEVQRLDVRVGDTVLVKRAGDVIPRVEGVVLADRPADAERWIPPKVCPRCGSEIDRSQKRWRCTRGRACGAVELLVYAAGRSALDIEGLGEKLAQQLVERGLVVDLADIYGLTHDQIIDLDRMGERSTAKLLANIEAAKAQPLDRQLTALGLRMVGRQMCRRLSRHFGTLDAIRSATIDELAEVEGIGEVRAAFIIEDLAEIDDLLDRLVAAGINTHDEFHGEDGPDESDLPLDGLTIAVSGAMTGPFEGRNRDAMTELIESLGGRSSGSVSGRTDFLVTNETDTAKARRAAELDVPVLTPEEFATRFDLGD